MYRHIQYSKYHLLSGDLNNYNIWYTYIKIYLEKKTDLYEQKIRRQNITIFRRRNSKNHSRLRIKYSKNRYKPNILL